MILKNKLNITDYAELARQEEKISKAKAIKLFENNVIEDNEIDSFNCLAKMHKFLFEDRFCRRNNKCKCSKR